MESEKNLGQADPEKDPAMDSLFAKQEWLEAWIEGNLRFPQTFSVIGLMLAESFLRDKTLDVDKFRYSALSEAQLRQVKTAMNSAHATNHIPFASREKIGVPFPHSENIKGQKNFAHKIISDGDFSSLWRSSKETALFYVSSMIEALKLSEHMPNPASVGKILNSDEDLKQKVSSVFQASVAIIREPEAQAIARDYRSLYNYKHEDQTAITHAEIKLSLDPRTTARRIFEKFVSDKVRERLPNLADRIPENIFAGRF